MGKSMLVRLLLGLEEPAISALDTASHFVTLRAVRKLAGTRIVVARRLSTVRHAGRVIVIDGKRVTGVLISPSSCNARAASSSGNTAEAK